jgi:hypothetical protein
LHLRLDQIRLRLTLIRLRQSLIRLRQPLIRLRLGRLRPRHTAAGRDAQPAAIAFRRVNLDYVPYHSSLLANRKLCFLTPHRP